MRPLLAGEKKGLCGGCTTKRWGADEGEEEADGKCFVDEKHETNVTTKATMKLVSSEAIGGVGVVLADTTQLGAKLHHIIREYHACLLTTCCLRHRLVTPTLDPFFSKLSLVQPKMPRASLLLPLILSLLSPVFSAPISPTPLHQSPFHPLHLLLVCAVIMLLASLVKSLNLVTYGNHPRVDRVVATLCLSTILLFLFHRLTLASAAGDISLTRFFQYFLAGGICAFLTHAACTPIDVVKTRIQTTQGRYSGMLDAFQKIVAEEGPATLLKGLGATASGYFLHGAFKYSFYEVFKLLFSPDAATAIKPPLAIAAFSGFCAECIACMLLCPMEAIRIRSVADATFPAGVITGLSQLLKLEGLHGWYKGLPAMLLKQVPYTVGQFVSFELAVVIVKRVVETVVGVQDGPTAVAYISSCAGLLAGITAAIISHPGDTILSKINQEESDGSAWSQITRVARSAGILGLFLGLGPRLLQVSCMIGGQFLIYDSIKLWCGIVPAAALPSDATMLAKAVAIEAVKKLR